MSEESSVSSYEGTAYIHQFAKMAIGAVICFAIGKVIDKGYDIGMTKHHQKKAVPK